MACCWLPSWPSRPIQESKVRFPVGAPGFQTHLLLIKCLYSLATLVLSYPIKNAADVDNRPLIWPVWHVSIIFCWIRVIFLFEYFVILFISVSLNNTAYTATGYYNFILKSLAYPCRPTGRSKTLAKLQKYNNSCAVSNWRIKNNGTTLIECLGLPLTV